MNWQKIRTHIVMVTGSQLLQKATGFLVIALMTRHLARAEMGAFFLAVGIGTIAAQATELGTTRHIIRTVARNHAGALEELSRALSLRLPVMAVVFLLVNLACLVVRPALSETLLLVTTYLMLQDIQFSFAAFFNGLELYGYRVMVDLVGQVMLAVLALAIVLSGGGLYSLLLAYVAANASVVAVTLWMISSRHGRPKLSWDPATATGVARQSLPIFAVTLLDTVHFKADTIMLGFMKPLTAVASYDAAYRLFEVSRLAIRPVALIFFPICVGMAARREWPQLRALFGKLTRTSLLLGGAATLVVVAIAGLLVPAAFGSKYSDSIPLVRVLYLTAPVLFTGLLAVSLIHTLHLERYAIRAAIGCIITNVTLNAIAIPRWGPIGCAWNTVITQTLWTVWLGRILYRHLDEAQPDPVDVEPEPSSLAV
jgi:O-antigen/teichoic acid export membrane protein